MSNDIAFDTFDHLRYLWGNVPAFDVLDLPKNEDAAYDRDLSLCFADECFFDFIKHHHLAAFSLSDVSQRTKTCDATVRDSWLRMASLRSALTI